MGTATAQFGSGIVFDPTNYHNALLRYYQLQQHLAGTAEELREDHRPTQSCPADGAIHQEHAGPLPGAVFAVAETSLHSTAFGNTVSWVNGINTGVLPNINTGYLKATTPLSQYDPYELSGMDSTELGRVQSQYASIELADGANMNAMATIGSIRGGADNVQTQIGNLEDDSFSGDSDLNSEVSVLNKINAAGVLTLRTVQDSNKLLASLLEQQTIVAKQQRDSTANAINLDIGRQASMGANLSQVTGTITDSLRKLPHAVGVRRRNARASKELTACKPISCSTSFRRSTICSPRTSASSTPWARIFSARSPRSSSPGSESNPPSPPPSGRPAFQFDHFASLLLTISFGFAMVNYYSTPIPGIGTSFHNFVTDEAQFLSSQIDQAQLQTVVSQVADFESRMDSPSWGDFFGTAIYVIVTILLAAAQAIAIVVIAYGFIATAVCVLVGPVFIPFFIVPKMEWLFWGWFRCFIQYAFYQVIAAAVVYVIGNLMLGALRLPPAGTLSTVQLIGWFPVLFITFLASIYVLLKIPSLTNHIFSGTAGGSSAGLLEAPAAVMNRVM